MNDVMSFAGCQMIRNALAQYVQYSLESIHNKLEEDRRLIQNLFLIFAFLLALAVVKVFKQFKVQSQQLRDAHQIILLVPTSAIEDPTELQSYLEDN